MAEFGHSSEGAWRPCPPFLLLLHHQILAQSSSLSPVGRENQKLQTENTTGKKRREDFSPSSFSRGGPFFSSPCSFPLSIPVSPLLLLLLLHNVEQASRQGGRTRALKEGGWMVLPGLCMHTRAREVSSLSLSLSPLSPLSLRGDEETEYRAKREWGRGRGRPWPCCAVCVCKGGERREDTTTTQRTPYPLTAEGERMERKEFLGAGPRWRMKRGREDRIRQ